MFDGGRDEEPGAAALALQREYRCELARPRAGGEQRPPEGQLLCLERPVRDIFDVMKCGQLLEHRGLARPGCTDEHEGHHQSPGRSSAGACIRRRARTRAPSVPARRGRPRHPASARDTGVGLQHGGPGPRADRAPDLRRPRRGDHRLRRTARGRPDALVTSGTVANDRDLPGGAERDCVGIARGFSWWGRVKTANTTMDPHE